jgi:hypothetical protein
VKAALRHAAFAALKTLGSLGVVLAGLALWLVFGGLAAGVAASDIGLVLGGAAGMGGLAALLAARPAAARVWRSPPDPPGK